MNFQPARLAVREYSGEMADDRQPKRRSGGERKTGNGKVNSSPDAITNRSQAKDLRILPGETQGEFDEVERGWTEEFGPETYMERRLVGILVDNEWLLRRAVRRLYEAEATTENVELKQRQKASAEATFYRSFNALQRLRKDLMRQERHAEWWKDRAAKLEKELQKRPPAPVETTDTKPHDNAKIETPMTRAQQFFRGDKHPKKRKKIPILDQWIEIEIQDGKTVTALYPSNEELIKRGQAMLPPPELVFRRLHFVNGVPPEYHWTTRNPVARERGGMGIQRMTIGTWLDVIEQEKASGTGHIGPCGGNLPRPEERGGCECEVCTHNRAVLEAREGG